MPFCSLTGREHRAVVSVRHDGTIRPVDSTTNNVTATRVINRVLSSVGQDVVEAKVILGLSVGCLVCVVSVVRQRQTNRVVVHVDINIVLTKVCCGTETNADLDFVGGHCLECRACICEEIEREGAVVLEWLGVVKTTKLEKRQNLKNDKT